MEQFDPKTYITRKEKYLANMAGSGEPYPEPITRHEKYLAAIADRIASGGGGGGGADLTVIADQFSPTKPDGYAIGDYCVYNGSLYKAIAAHTGAWSAADFEEVTVAGELEKSNATLENKANIDGSYETMTVGNAEQLVTTVGVDDNSPYNFRTSGGSVDIGDRETVNAVVGGTVAWNQLAKEINSTNYIAEAGVTATFANGVATFTSPTNSYGIRFATVASMPNHVYVAFMTAKISEAGTINAMIGGTAPAIIPFALSTSFARVGGMTKAQASTSGIYWYVAATQTSINKQVDVKDFIIVDLTQMFGSTIADYIYSLEQATAGAGVAWFKKLFPKPYYPYNAGELLSVNTSQHKMVGFNAYDNSTGKAKVIGGNQYEITGAYTSLSLDGETITPVSGKFTPSVSGELTVTGGGSNTCIHLVWDGERDGEYEPYKEWVYPLDSSLTLRGIPKLDASGNLYYDGDTYAPDGTVTRKYGVVDLGTLNWTYDDSSDVFRTSNLSSVIGNGLNILCLKYATVSDLRENALANLDKVIGCNKASAASSGNHPYGAIIVKDFSYSDAATFQAAMSGVYLVYELATPTTENATPYTQIQSVDDFGTEEYTDYAYENGDRDVAIPVGNNTVYSPNLRAKLEMSPNSPDGDGLYVVEQSNGQNEYVPLVIPTELPTAPSEDGTYTLKITVSGGTVTKSWIAEE